MKTTKGNKLIAEFMSNFEKYKDWHSYVDSGLQYISSWGLQSDDKKDEDAKRFEYHSSWDWLMPVVEKIEKLYYAVIITQNTCTIQASIMGDRTVISKQISNYDEDNTKLSNTYKAVVEFIQWYNENK